MASKSRSSRRSTEELRKACSAVGYEYGTLQNAALICAQAATESRNEVGTVALESVVLHTRVLIEFFYNKAKGDYIRAEEFFETAADWRSRVDHSKTLAWPAAVGGSLSIRQVEKLCNTAATHLSWGRIDAPKAKWNLPGLLMHFDMLMAQFIEHAPNAVITLCADGQLYLGGHDDTMVTRYRSK